MTKFTDFADSPFGPLCLHMAKAKECVSKVTPMFERLLAADWDGLDEIAEQVFRLEHEADKIKNEIREEMPRAFSLPLFRGDLLSYLKLQDDIADTAEDIAVVLTLKRMSFPAELVDDLRAYVAKVIEVCEILFNCTDQLADFRESDFIGERGRAIMGLIEKAEHAEWEADKKEYALSKRMFALSDDQMHPTDMYLWSKIMMELGKLANHADKTAERLRRMIAR